MCDPHAQRVSYGDQWLPLTRRELGLWPGKHLLELVGTGNQVMQAVRFRSEGLAFADQTSHLENQRITAKPPVFGPGMTGNVLKAQERRLRLWQHH